MKPLLQHIVTTPLGPMRLAASPSGLVGAWFTHDALGPPPDEVAQWQSAPDHPVLARAAEQLAAYFRGELHTFDLPLDLDTGTPFQVAAWSELMDIAWGETISYGELARLSNRFANVLQALQVDAGDHVFLLCGRLPELYVALLGALKHQCVVTPLFSAFGPEPIATRLTLGHGRVLCNGRGRYLQAGRDGNARRRLGRAW